MAKKKTSSKSLLPAPAPTPAKASRRTPAIMSPVQAAGGKALKLLVFDMGHVFVDFDWNEVCQGFCRISGKNRDELKDVMSYLATLGYESGKINTAGFLSELNQCLGTSMNLEEFTALWVASFHENQEMALLLAKLKAQRPLYLLSNTNEIHYEYLQSTYNVARHFQELILSYKVGSSKPEPDIYQEVLKRSGLNADECLFVDDLDANVRAAQQLGIRTIHFKGAGPLKQSLQALGFKT